MTELKILKAAKEYEGIDPYYGDLESRAFIAGAEWALEEAGFKWIPVSEGLPGNEMDIVEVTFNYANFWLIAYEPNDRRIARASYNDGEFEVHAPLGSFKVAHDGSGVVNVFAWRPLPKPFNENE